MEIYYYLKNWLQGFSSWAAFKKVHVPVQNGISVASYEITNDTNFLLIEDITWTFFIRQSFHMYIHKPQYTVFL